MLVQAFPYFYVPYEDDFPAEPQRGSTHSCCLLRHTCTQIFLSPTHISVHMRTFLHGKCKARFNFRPHAAPSVLRTPMMATRCAAQAFLRQFAQTLEAAMHAGLESGVQRHQRVFSVQLVRACPFYGYHPGERLFIKVIM